MARGLLLFPRLWLRCCAQEGGKRTKTRRREGEMRWLMRRRRGARHYGPLLIGKIVQWTILSEVHGFLPLHCR